MPFDLITVGAVCADVMVRPVDTIPGRGQLTLVPHLEMHMGGLAGVTAAVMAQLGGSAAFVGRLGADSFADFLLDTLRKHGVDVSHVRKDPEHHSSATVVLVSNDGERTFLHHLGTNAATVEEDLPLDVIAASRVFHWGGPSLTPQLDGKPMGRIFEQVRARGVKCSMDTCYDGNGTWLPLIEPSLPHLDLVFSSLEEARKYTNRQSPEDIAAFYRSYGVGIVVIKLGENGIYAEDQSGSVRIPAHGVEVVDTTGAGDAACGGFLYAYLEGWPLERCARMANAVGALTVQSMGGAEAIQSLEQVMALIEEEPCLQ